MPCGSLIKGISDHIDNTKTDFKYWPECLDPANSLQAVQTKLLLFDLAYTHLFIEGIVMCLDVNYNHTL